MTASILFGLCPYIGFSCPAIVQIAKLFCWRGDLRLRLLADSNDSHVSDLLDPACASEAIVVPMGSPRNEIVLSRSRESQILLRVLYICTRTHIYLSVCPSVCASVCSQIYGRERQPKTQNPSSTSNLYWSLRGQALQCVYPSNFLPLI